MHLDKYFRLFIVLAVLSSCAVCTFCNMKVKSDTVSNTDVTPVFPEEAQTPGVTRLVPIACSDYKPPTYPPKTVVSSWSINFEVVAPDGITRMCLVGLGIKPTDYKFSPGGQFLFTFTWINHNWRYDVYQVSTGKGICGNSGDGNVKWSPYYCPIVKLADGRWWSGDFPSITLESNEPKLWALIRGGGGMNGSPRLSPDGKWVIGRADSWYIASADGKIIKRYSMPYSFVIPSATACGQFPSQIAWRVDSKQFAIIQDSDKIVFVWNVQDDGNVVLGETITLDKCPLTLKFSDDGKIQTR